MNEWKADFLAYWGYTPGTPEAEAAWAAKVDMHLNPKKAPMAFVQRDVCYDSPIDGRPITNKQARLEDLKRSGCIEYDPGMKQDRERKLKEADESLDRSVDESVEREFASMPARKKEQLAAELESGATPEIKRLEA